MEELMECSPVMSPIWMQMAGGLNVGNDVVLMLVPMSILHAAQFRTRELVALSVVFGIGIVSIVTGVVRMVLMSRVFGGAITDLTAHNEMTIVVSTGSL